jgi:hypothetical protein
MKTIVMLAAISTVAVALTSAWDAVPATEMTVKVTRVYEDRHLTSMCLVGAMAGAFMAIYLWPGKSLEVVGDTPDERAVSRARNEKLAAQRLCLKFGVSLFSGCTLTPMIMSWRGWELNSDLVLGTSTIVAGTFVYIVHRLQPVVDRMSEAGNIVEIIGKMLAKGK